MRLINFHQLLMDGIYTAAVHCEVCEGGGVNIKG